MLYFQYQSLTFDVFRLLGFRLELLSDDLIDRCYKWILGQWSETNERMCNVLEQSVQSRCMEHISWWYFFDRWVFHSPLLSWTCFAININRILIGKQPAFLPRIFGIHIDWFYANRRLDFNRRLQAFPYYILVTRTYIPRNGLWNCLLLFTHTVLFYRNAFRFNICIQFDTKTISN